MDLALYKDPIRVKKRIDEEILKHITQRCNEPWSVVIHELLISWKKSLPEDTIQYNYICEKLKWHYAMQQQQQQQQRVSFP
jgi:hypothetical protein